MQIQLQVKVQVQVQVQVQVKVQVQLLVQAYLVSTDDRLGLSLSLELVHMVLRLPGGVEGSLEGTRPAAANVFEQANWVMAGEARNRRDRGAVRRGKGDILA